MSRVILGMSAARHDQMVGFRHSGDKALARLATDYRRAIEDGQVSDGTTPYTFEELLRQVTHLQRVRFRLRMRYGARDAYGPEGDRGTDVYDHYYRLDQPPSYALALAIDRARFDVNQSSVLNWATPLPVVTPARKIGPFEGQGGGMIRSLPCDTLSNSTTTGDYTQLDIRLIMGRWGAA